MSGSDDQSAMSNEIEKLVDRLLNMDNEMEQRAKFPESSISSEAAKEEILTEVRTDLQAFLQKAVVQKLHDLKFKSEPCSYCMGEAWSPEHDQLRGILEPTNLGGDTDTQPSELKNRETEEAA